VVPTVVLPGQAELSSSEIKFLTVVLLHCCAMEQLWSAESMNKTQNAFRESSSIRHATDLYKVPQTCLGGMIIADGNTTKSEGAEIVLTPGKNCLALRIGDTIHPLAFV
jgi:hypothetical protein